MAESLRVVGGRKGDFFFQRSGAGGEPVHLAFVWDVEKVAQADLG